jgi:hypothetical protein
VVFCGEIRGEFVVLGGHLLVVRGLIFTSEKYATFLNYFFAFFLDWARTTERSRAA